MGTRPPPVDPSLSDLTPVCALTPGRGDAALRS